MVFQQIKLLLLSIIAVFRRMCCFGRRRKPSHNFDSLESIKVETSNSVLSKQNKYVERDWNSWDDAPRTVEEHIEEYRQRLAKPPLPQKEDPEPDIFSELAPTIKPQMKFYLDDPNKDDNNINLSRLEAKSDIPITTNADLEDWIDEDLSGGWEELDTEKTKQLIREKRRELRNQRLKNTKNTGCEPNGINTRDMNTNSYR